jgi:hypothetical protein
MVIDGLDVDLAGLHILPGLVNAHDHLEFALFPRLGCRVYENATEWAHDIYHPDQSPVCDHLRVPKEVRLFWGGLRNLLAGVTLVCHHNPWHPVFDSGFPVRVLQRFGWAHSLAFSPDVSARFAAAPRGAPLILHLAEGTDIGSAEEIYRLDRMGLLGPRTVLVHAVGLDAGGWELVRRSGASVVWCPRSNKFTLGRTLPVSTLMDMGIPFALGTDSGLTTEGDLLDEIAFAGIGMEGAASQSLRVLRTRGRADDFIAVREFGSPPELVVIGGRVQLVSESLAGSRRRDGWSKLHVEGRLPALVRSDIAALIQRTEEALGIRPIRLAGREVYS